MGRVIFPVTDSQGNRTDAQSIITLSLPPSGARWSDPNFWAPFLGSARLPTLNDIVTLPANSEPLLFDVDDGAIGTLTTHRPFHVVPGAARRLQVRTNFVQHHGVFRVVTQDPFEMHWPLVDESTFVGGHTDVALPTDPGLWLDSCDVDIAGEYALPMALATQDLVAQQDTVLLDRDPVGWRVGGEISIAPMLPVGVGGSHDIVLPVPGSPEVEVPNWADAFDYATIVSISGRTVRFSPELTFDHPRCGPFSDGSFEGAEVLYLSRRVRFTGRPLARPHILIMSHEPGANSYRRDNVETRYLGPVRPDPEHPGRWVGVLGRYAFHFHRLGDRTRGTVLNNNVDVHSGNHAAVSHASHGITWADHVAHDTFGGAPYWWDPFSETDMSHDITYLRATASRATASPGAEGNLLSGFDLNQGHGSRLLDIRAFGVLGGQDSSGIHWPEGLTEFVWGVLRARIHNCRKGTFAWQNGSTLHQVMDGSRLYRCERAIQNGAYANTYIYEGYETRECPAGMDEVAQGIVVEGQGPPRDGQTEAPIVRGGRDLGGQDVAHHVVTDHRVFEPLTATRFENRRFDGPLTAPGFAGSPPNKAFLFKAEEHPDWLDVIDCTFAGVDEAWFTDTCHPGSRMVLRDSTRHLELRRRDQPGDHYEPRWNASVTIRSL